MSIPEAPTWPLRVGNYFAGAFIIGLMGISVARYLPQWLSLAAVFTWWGGSVGCATLMAVAWETEKRRLSNLRAAFEKAPQNSN